MRLIFKSLSLVLAAALLAAPAAFAQNTGGVFPPTVNEGHRSVQYRAAINPDNAQDEFGFAQRLHYQQAINDDFMWRILGQTRKTDDSDVDLDFIGAELFWEFSDNEDNYKHGVRFDGRIRFDDRAEFLGFNWIHQWNLDDGWSARAIALASVQVGDNSADGVNLQTRTQIAKNVGGGITLGLENYSNYGNTGGDIGGFNDQSHTVGPFASIPIADRLTLWGGPLFGISRAAPDVEARLWLTQSF